MDISKLLFKFFSSKNHFQIRFFPNIVIIIFFMKSSNSKITHKSKGILDLGGASTQIVFVPSGMCFLYSTHLPWGELYLS